MSLRYVFQSCSLYRGDMVSHCLYSERVDLLEEPMILYYRSYIRDLVVGIQISVLRLPE